MCSLSLKKYLTRHLCCPNDHPFNRNHLCKITIPCGFYWLWGPQTIVGKALVNGGSITCNLLVYGKDYRVVRHTLYCYRKSQDDYKRIAWKCDFISCLLHLHCCANCVLTFPWKVLSRRQRSLLRCNSGTSIKADIMTKVASIIFPHVFVEICYQAGYTFSLNGYYLLWFL